jgi:hypothetical protein
MRGQDVRSRVDGQLRGSLGMIEVPIRSRGPFRDCSGENKLDYSINLNTVSPDVLVGMCCVGPARAEALMRRRPFRNWDDVAEVPGISELVVESLKRSGAHLR